MRLNRYSILCFIPFVIVASAAPSTQPVFDPADCAAFHGGGPLLGEAAPIPAPPMRIRWTFSVDNDPPPPPRPAAAPSTLPATAPVEAGPASYEAAAAVVGQTVFVADTAGGLRALDLGTGKRKWLYTAEDGFDATPLVVNGRIFIGDLDGIFHCVAADTGREIWKFDAGSQIHSSANYVNSDAIVFGDDGSDIYCLSAIDGKVLWHSHAGDRVNGTPAVAGGSVFVSGCDAQLRVMTATDGKEQWSTDLSALAPGSPAITADRIVIGTDQGRVVCLARAGSANAKPLWIFEQVGQQAMVYSSPAISDGIVVFGARDRNVWALDLVSGKSKWSFPTRGDVDASPVISGGRVYAASKDRHLYVLDLHTGKQLWEFNAAKPITASPTVARGVVILCDGSGTVRCLEPSNPIPAEGAFMFDLNWHALFHLDPGITILEKVLRAVIVYFFLILGLRIAGKRELAQLNPFDLIVLLMLSNTVQNAIIGADNSVIGGMIGAVSLLGVNWLMVRLSRHNRRFSRFLEGRPDVLIRDGHIQRNHLQRELISRAELSAAAHKQGIASLADVERAILEPTGNISFIQKRPTPDAERHNEIMNQLRAIAERLGHSRPSSTGN